MKGRSESSNGNDLEQVYTLQMIRIFLMTSCHPIQLSRAQDSAKSLMSGYKNFWVVPVDQSVTLEHVEQLFFQYLENPSVGTAIFQKYPLLQTIFDMLKSPPSECMFTFSKTHCDKSLILMCSAKPLLSKQERDVGDKVGAEDVRKVPWWNLWIPGDCSAMNLYSHETMGHKILICFYMNV